MIFPHQEKHAGKHDYKRDKNPNIFQKEITTKR